MSSDNISPHFMPNKLILFILVFIFTCLEMRDNVSNWLIYGRPIGQAIYIFILLFVMVALCNRADHYIFAL